MTVIIKTTFGEELYKLRDVMAVHQSADEITVVMPYGCTDLVLKLATIASILVLPNT